MADELDNGAAAPAPAADSGDTLLTGDKTQEPAPVAAEGEAPPAEAEGDKAGDEGQITPPETYADFVMPEGIELDAALLESATPLFKELGLTQEQAQKLVDFQASQIQAGAQRQNDTFNQLMNDWRTQSTNDKEFGGDKFEESVGVARSALDKFGTPELKTLFEEHGVGNHPEVIRMLVKVGRLTQEDKPGGQMSQGNTELDRVKRMYST